MVVSPVRVRVSPSGNRGDWLRAVNYTALPLQPLDERSLAALLREELGTDPSLAPLAESTPDRVGGNPFVLGELIRDLVESGPLEGERGAFHAAGPIDEAARSASAQTRECFLLTQCTSVAGPWVVFGPLGPQPVPAGTSVACPDSDRLQLPVGSDYELTGPASSFVNVNVTRFMPGPGVGLINGSVAYFWAISLSDSSGAFRPQVGCIPQPSRQAAEQTATAQAGAPPWFGCARRACARPAP